MKGCNFELADWNQWAYIHLKLLQNILLEISAPGNFIASLLKVKGVKYQWAIIMDVIVDTTFYGNT